MRPLRALLVAGACIATAGFGASPPAWVPWIGSAFGELRGQDEVDTWYVVYQPNKQVVVDSRAPGSHFVPVLALYDGAGTLLDSFDGKPGQDKGGVLMPSTVPATNILRLELTSHGGVFPADYEITKQ